MNLILYALIVFMFSFLLQLILIIIIEKKKSKKLNEISIEIENKRNIRNIRIAIKLLIALIISAFLSIISFYGFGIATLIGLRQGH